ncbi:MAG: hypothetical protein ACI9XO_002610, partial [Paraglaciecola sp.]
LTVFGQLVVILIVYFFHEYFTKETSRSFSTRINIFLAFIARKLMLLATAMVCL